MQKWEHKIVGYLNNCFEVRNEKGKVIGREPFDLHATRMGEDGWELVAVAAPLAFSFEAIFKRPKQ